MATRGVLGDLASEAVAAGLPRIEIESVGGVDAAARVAAGEAFDLVFLAEGALRRLAADGHVVADSVLPLVLSQTAVAVPAEEDEAATAVPTAAFADAAALRAALRAVARIGYSTGPSGTAVLALIDAWRMTAQLDDRLVQARPGIPVARLLADGEIDLGFQQVSELVGARGVRILGVLPDECAIDTVFAGAVGAASADPGAAAAVLALFARAARDGVAAAHSFGSPPTG